MSEVKDDLISIERCSTETTALTSETETLLLHEGGDSEELHTNLTTLSLGWYRNKQYKTPVLSREGVKYSRYCSEGEENLPQKLFDVIENFQKNLNTKVWDKELWKIDWNRSTPGLQFHLNADVVGIYDQPLQKTNIFKYQDDQQGFFSVHYDDQLSSRVADSLFENTEQWWRDQFTYIKGLKPVETTLITDERDENYNNVDITDDKVTIGKGKIINDALEYLGNIFKIRIQCKPQYQIWCMNKLIELFTPLQGLNSIGRLISVIKCSLVYSEIYNPDPNRRLASIILYVRPGRITACALLKKLSETFNGYQDQVGLDLPSRFNVRYNKMLYYSGGDGDTKVRLNGAIGKDGKNLGDKYLIEEANGLPEKSFFKKYVLTPGDICKEKSIEDMFSALSKGCTDKNT